MSLYSKKFNMSDLEKIINNNDKSNTKLKAFVAWLALTIATMLGQWNAMAQTSSNRDRVLDQIEQTLKVKWWDYKSLLEQRDALLRSYEVRGKDVMEEFVATQKRDFERSYQTNEYGMQNTVKNISLILENDFWMNVQGMTPVQILSTALQVIANEDSMSWLKQYTSNLSGEFDLDFMNAYGYIQSKNPNTWISVNGVLMPNRELDWLAWTKTLGIILDILNDGTFTIQLETPSYAHPMDSNDGNHISTAPVQNNQNVTPSKDTKTQPQRKTDNQWTSIDEPAIDDSNTIDLDEVDDEAPVISHNKPADTSNPTNSNDVVNPQNNWSNIDNQTDDSLLDLDDYSFRDPIADIVDNMSWTLKDLEQNLDQDNLVDISYSDVLNTVNSFKNDNLKRHVMYYLLKNDVVSAQKLLGMELDCDSAYPDYIAWKKLDKSQLQKMQKLWQTRRFDSPEAVLNNPNIPQDVKDVYNQILDGKIKTDNLPYSIVSKTDYRIYLFSADNHLLDRQNTILWADAGDKKNDPSKWIQTTPGGEYRVDSKRKQYMWKDFFINYGTHYIVLRPMDNQYDMTEKYTMWIHWDFKWDKKRKKELYSENSQDHRASNGCINVDSDLFGEIYNHLPRWSVIYVTFE